MRTYATVIAVALSLLCAPTVRAADEPADLDRAKTMLTDLAALRKAKDASGFQGELKNVVELHNKLEHGATRGKLQKELGAALKSKHLEGAHAAIIAALSELNDPKGAYKQLKRLLPGPKDEEVDELAREAVRAVGKLAPDGAIKQLMDLGEKAKDRASAIAAIDALGGFRTSKKRTAVLEGLIKLVMRFMPPRGVQAGEATIKRWEELGPPLVRALCALTGQKIGDPIEWLQMYKENKKNLDNLFVE
jgi:hypothetical protein